MKEGFSIITTCRGRLHHLKQSLPGMIGQLPEELVVVDYDCPDGTSGWLASACPQVRTVRETDPRGFSLARARNAGVQAAGASWLCFVDADTLIQVGWLEWLQANASDDTYFVAEDGAVKDATGILVCSREAFLAAGCYDEAIRGWGGEDIDLRKRLSSLGLKVRGFPMRFVQSIPHSDELRDKVLGLSINQLSARGALYVEAKFQIGKKFGGMDLCCRESLLESLSGLVEREKREEIRAKWFYPLRVFRYCRGCAKVYGYNQILELTRTRGTIFSPKTIQIRAL